MITLEHVYILSGVLIAAFAVMSVRDRANPKRIGNAAFWLLLAASFLFGSELSDLENGVLVLLLVVVGGSGALGRAGPAATPAEERARRAASHGNLLFVPALIVPFTALLGTLFLKNSGLVDPKQVTLISLAAGVLIALAFAMAWLRPPLLAPLAEGGRIMDTIGWAAILPQLLASLGAVFALAGVGKAVGHVATDWLPLDTPVAAVLVYCLGMALFTIVMGNAFAAFPVMTAAIGLPLIAHRFHGDAIVMSAVGMLSGFSGTLMTPMAANFNIVPAALLELPDRDGVIKAQIPTALILLVLNTVLMEVLVYRV